MGPAMATDPEKAAIRATIGRRSIEHSLRSGSEISNSAASDCIAASRESLAVIVIAIPVVVPMVAVSVPAMIVAEIAARAAPVALYVGPSFVAGRDPIRALIRRTAP